MIIDAHHHFWDYSPAEYGWIDDSMSAIARDFGPADLAAAAGEVGVQGVVSVQARQSLAETDWLLDLADQSKLILGVVGWAPLADRGIADVLGGLASRAKLKAVRHVVQDEPDPHFLEARAFNQGVDLLEQHNLAYDLLVFERQLPQTIDFVDRHPNVRFVLDHIAKPRIKEAELSPWRENLAQLAERPNVCCKLSGIVTEADHADWTPGGLRPYFDIVLECFGPDRMMFGSDWPVCLLASGYARWFATVESWASALSEDERRELFGATAARAYQL
ncbi:Amidohydrolase [Posidoniimonas polymericola]|uniref:Amidohydrolase n=1 Tax=Posidoniimonas polymericola TaxID=2528002 RepID=A0A5C5YRX2_9BACT|nr:amidohydrolase family protein [Posidoniimonas polymericola]TWT77608.1 Amidohydrolase [Posidoniimonas polymericola]